MNKFMKIKLIITVVIFAFTFLLILCSILCSLIREVTGAVNSSGEITPLAKFLESAAINLCYIAVTPVAILPYIFSDFNGAVGALMTIRICGINFKKIIFFAVAFFTVACGAGIFLFNFLFQVIFYDTFPDGTRESYCTCGSLILGIGIFLCVQAIIDLLVGYGKVKPFNVENFIVARNKLTTKQQKLFEKMRVFFRRKSGKFFTKDYILQKFDKSSDDWKLILKILKVIPDMKYRQHRRRNDRVYGVVFSEHMRKGAISSKPQDKKISVVKEVKRLSESKKKLSLPPLKKVSRIYPK